MSILVTGATGFIGSAIIRRLLAENLDIRVLIRKTSNRLNLAGQNIEIFVGDILDMESLDHALKGCEVLIHTAADYRIWAGNPEEIMDSNVLGTKNIMTAAANAGVNKILYTSSVAALGTTNLSDSVNEDTPSTLEEKIGTYKISNIS